jgi:uncharacterized protein (TIGR03435 family)
MKDHERGTLNGRRNPISATTAIVVLAISMVVGALQLRAQASQTTDTPLSSFEVASIKQDHSADDTMSIHTAPDRFTAINVTAQFLIEFAFNMQPFQHSGGPGWIASDKYDIDAKEEDSFGAKLEQLPASQRVDQIRLMVQSLLADRFKLRVNHQTKEHAVYTLVVTKNGPTFSKTTVTPRDLTGSNAPSPTAQGKGVWQTGRGQLSVNQSSIGVFAIWLSRQPEISSVVLDQTGLKGNYDFDLQWTPDQGQIPGGQASDGTFSPNSYGPSIFAALQDQLGLRLEKTMGPMDTIVVESIEKPSPN